MGQIGNLYGHYLVRYDKSENIDHHVQRLDQHPLIRSVSVQQQRQKKSKRMYVNFDQQQRIVNKLGISDPLFKNQWHLLNREQPGNDINVTGVWEQGVTGKNVIAAIIDDGVQYDHPDIADNFYLNGSYDFNEKTKYPKPRLSDDYHGTRCAGAIAAVKNEVCGVGVAYEAKVAGIRILGGSITDVDEALALNYGFQENQIYSCSWGPEDDATHVEGPNEIVYNAMLNGIYNGRGGLGSIFVFATGNGGFYDDNCNYDGYTNSIYTISISAIDRYNQHPQYSEECSANMASTYSSGKQSYIQTTEFHGQCTNRFGGTSAACPLAVGILSLALSVRPDLSWRDMQYLTMLSARPISMEDIDWSQTFAGRWYSHKFGYGSIDAFKLVEVARSWQKVNQQTNITIEAPYNPTPIPFDEDGKNFTLQVTADHVKVAQLKRVEHVTVTVDVSHECRGDLDFFLISPNNVVSYIGPHREADESVDGFKNWTFMSVKHWEEDAVGTWTLNIVDIYNEDKIGSLNYWSLAIYGESLINSTDSQMNPPPVVIPPPGQNVNDEIGAPLTDTPVQSWHKSNQGIALFIAVTLLLTIPALIYIVALIGKKRNWQFLGKQRDVNSYEYLDMDTLQNTFVLSDVDEDMDDGGFESGNFLYDQIQGQKSQLAASQELQQQDDAQSPQKSNNQEQDQLLQNQFSAAALYSIDSDSDSGDSE
ncbi:hypothetical protein MIR68_011574 [Amoeboaphelidium protococcarum]|nr:hypothetical protein MIR68_011574 [Amoeboaphelidium protococcarum]